MKFKIEIGPMTISMPAKEGNVSAPDIVTPNIMIAGEYSMEEINGVYELTRKAIKELPEIMEDMMEAVTSMKNAEEKITEESVEV